jgi:dTDP-glucose 4,6-dehydratase
MNKRIIVTGGAGFIGANLVQMALSKGYKVLVIDKLTYAGSKKSLNLKDKNLTFKKIDICNKGIVYKTIKDFRPNFIYHLAAESHVDRSIDFPDVFIKTNILGTYNIIECIRELSQKNKSFKKVFKRLVHVSTDEVYGTATLKKPFTINTPYNPTSPYSSSKASSDHLVKAWCKTYGLPFVVTNCSNNYGPYQFPEKLIPHIILRTIKRKKLPIYGDGLQKRDWIHVTNHVEGLLKAGERGTNGATYLFGTAKATTNLSLVKIICSEIDKKTNKNNSFQLVSHVKDRPAHDRLYLIDPSKTIKDLNWKPDLKLKENISQTIDWYLDNADWLESITKSSSYNLSRLGKN